MKDILLTHGYFLEQDPAEKHPYPPLGILCLSSHLKRKGLEVGLFDSTFGSLEEFRFEIERRKPPIVGISGNLMTRRNVLAMTRVARENGATVVLGGPEPYGYAEEYLHRGADVIVNGEGERTLAELVPHLLEHGARSLEEFGGVAFLGESDRVVETPAPAAIADLDGQPFPDRGAIDIDRYLEAWQRGQGKTSVSLITARGCPFKCRWCSHGVYGFSHRRRSPANVADEVEEIVKVYSPDMLWYADDVFTINHGWINDYAAELRRRGLRVPFEAISREDRLNEEIIDTLSAMGCFRLWVGAESGSQQVLDRMERQTGAARTREVIRLLQARGIEAGTFIMLGYEGETRADLEATAEHLKAAPPDQFLTTVAYPIKGTPYYEEVADRIVPAASWEESTDRDVEIADRPSRSFYRFAIRWLVSEVAVVQARRRSSAFAPTVIRARLNAWLGRLGMLLTQHQTVAKLPDRGSR
jgi:radical SAM superfamily enzyme YgiQ (UPF0313 family)